jgi:hypothetical protein
MYLDYWMIVVLLLVWLIGLIHVAYSAFNDGVGESVDGMFQVLEDGGYIKTTQIEEDDDITVYLHKPTGFSDKYDKDS